MKKRYNATPALKCRLSKETNSVKNIVLDGVKALRIDEITTTFEVERELHPLTNQPFRIFSKRQVDENVKTVMSYDLVEVTPEELAVYRKSGIPSFVLKVEGKLYYTSIPSDLNLVGSSILGEHQCAVVGHECKRLSAASDEHGGCAKVRDCCQRIERYPWITKGYETFNTSNNCFLVVQCEHYEKCPPRPKLSATQVQKAKLGLAQLLWDVESREEVKKRLEKNGIKSTGAPR